MAGFSLLEVVIVIGLIAFVYVVAIPNFNLQTGTEVASRLGQLSQDVRAAFDYSVLTGKPVRLVFRPFRGDYWLETTDDRNFSLDPEIDPEWLSLSPEQQQSYFDESFMRYEDLIPEPVVDPEDEAVEIPLITPLIKAKERLRGARWRRVDSLEWGGRSLGYYLIIGSVFTENLPKPLTLDDGVEAVAAIHFLPQGYVERSVIHVFYALEEGVIDQEQEPYTVLIHPYEGYAEVRSGYQEIDPKNDEQF